MPRAGFTPPIQAANGKPWNFVLINGDDWFLDSYLGMPTFQAEWASKGVFYPMASCNEPLCFPGRAATYTGWRVERHDAVDNGSGSRYIASGGLANTLFSVLERQRYYNGFIGKIYNGLGENGNGSWGSQPWFHPGVHFMRGQWGAPNYFSWTEIDSTGNTYITHGTVDTNAAGTDYAVDVERLRAIEFLDGVPAGRPFCLCIASKGSHQDAGGNAVPPARYASSAVTLHEDSSFGLDLTTVGQGSWCTQVGVYPWGDADVTQARAEHTAALRVMLAVDEMVCAIFDSIVARGWGPNTIFLVKCDNAHAGGEGRFKAKGVPHRSATGAVMWAYVPGTTGGICYAPVGDIDVAPFFYAMAGATPMIACHGMSFHQTFLDRNHPHRLAMPLSNPEKDSPVFSGIQFGGNPGDGKSGRMYFRILPTSTKGAGQLGGYVDHDQTRNVIVPGDADILTFIERARS